MKYLLSTDVLFKEVENKHTSAQSWRDQINVRDVIFSGFSTFWIQCSINNNKEIENRDLWNENLIQVECTLRSNGATKINLSDSIYEKLLDIYPKTFGFDVPMIEQLVLSNALENYSFKYVCYEDPQRKLQYLNINGFETFYIKRENLEESVK